MAFEYLKIDTADFRDDNNNSLTINDFQEVMDNPSKYVYFKYIDQKYLYLLIYNNFIRTYGCGFSTEKMKRITKRLVRSHISNIKRHLNLFFIREEYLIKEDEYYFSECYNRFEKTRGIGHRFFDFIFDTAGVVFPNDLFSGDALYNRPVFYMNGKLVGDSNEEPSAYDYLKDVYQQALDTEAFYFKFTKKTTDARSEFCNNEFSFTANAIDEASRRCYKSTENPTLFIELFRDYLEKSMDLLNQGIEEIIENFYFINPKYRPML